MALFNFMKHPVVCHAYGTTFHAVDSIGRCSATFESLSSVSRLQGSVTVISFCRIIE